MASVVSSTLSARRRLIRSVRLMNSNTQRLDDLLRSAGIPVVTHPELGNFIMGLGGGWRYSGTVDFPFQEKVDLIFDLDLKTPDLPASMPQNILWIQEHLAEIWDAGAATVNRLSEAQQIESSDEFALDDLHFQLPDEPVETAAWQLTISPSYVHGSFVLTFRGLDVIDQRFEGP